MVELSIDKRNANCVGLMSDKKCCGFIGWLFGHKWEEFTTADTKFDVKVYVEINGGKLQEMSARNFHGFYLRCKRCGAKCDE